MNFQAFQEGFWWALGARTGEVVAKGVELAITTGALYAIIQIA